MTRLDYSRAEITARAQELYRQRDGSWADARREAFREKRAEIEARNRSPIAIVQAETGAP